MKSIVIEAPNSLSIINREIPNPVYNEVRIKVIYAGICGSDSHIYRGHNPFAKYPRVIGHEFFGIIDATGPNLSSDYIGRRVAIDPVLSCGNCYPCSIARPNVCESLNVMGVHVDGGFSEYINVPIENTYLIPDSISDVHATTIEPYSIAANVTAHLSPQKSDIALIYGAGTMGLTCSQVLKGVYGVQQIIIVDQVDERLERAKKCHADITFNTKKVDLTKKLEELNIRPTLIIDAACHPSILNEATQIASPAGKISIMGFSDEPSMISQKNITSKELSIFSSRLNSKRFPQVIDWLKNRLIDPSLILTHSFHFTDIEEAFSLFETAPQSCCKILLEFK